MGAIGASTGDKETAVRLLTIVQQHPLSHHTRTLSLFSGASKVRFQELADDLLMQLKDELPPDVYAAATEDGNRRLELDTAVLELLVEPVSSRLGVV